ncbi:MAG: hypothetical protein Q8K86_10765 [Candidatus Nanopelagicaceae bacterium]|nr:hypothetical protein [Candidatus Nanopelagicaceae bacterium]
MDIQYVFFCPKCKGRDIVTDSSPGATLRRCKSGCISWSPAEDWKYTIRIVEQQAANIEEFQCWFNGKFFEPNTTIHYTPKQRRVALFIKKYNAKHGYAPTLRETAKEMGVSTVTIFEHLRALARKGAVRIQKHQSRSVEVLDETLKETEGDV